MKVLAAPFRYHGGKQRTAQWIVPRLPKRSMYTEPFAGLLSVLLGRQPAKRELVNDIDRNLYAFWVTVRDQPDRLQEALSRSPLRCRDFWADARARLSDPELKLEDRAYWWAVAVHMGIGGGLRYATNHNPDVGAPTRWPLLQPLADRLQAVEVERRDGVEVLRRFAHHTDQTTYVDPPYPGSATLGDYTALPDFGRLAEALLAQKGACAVSGFPGDWPQLEAAGWERSTVSLHATLGYDHGPREASRRVEVLWTNYPPPAQGTLDVF